MAHRRSIQQRQLDTAGKILFYLLCIVAGGVAFGLSVLATRQPLGLRGLAFHPFNLLGFFIVITILDFLFAYETTRSGESIRLSVYSESSPIIVQQGFLFFVLCCIGIFVGIALSIRNTNPVKSSIRDNSADKSATQVLFLIAAALAAVTVALVVEAALSRGSIAYVAATRGVFFRDNPILYVFYSMLVPAFFIFGSRNNHPITVIWAFFLCVLLLLPMGSRGNLAILLVGVMFWVCRRVAIPVAALYIAAPLVAIGLTFYRWAARDSTVYGTFQQFLDAHGGLGGALFGTPEVSMAEAITINLAQPVLHRAPWDSIIGMILIPVPRAIAPFKPVGASTEFTQGANLSRWMLVKSDWTITGFANLLVEFSYIGAILVIGLLSYWWSRTLIKASADRMDIAFVGPVLIYFMYIFYRADLYNLGTTMWPALLILIGHTFLTRMLMRRSTQNSTRPLNNPR